MQDDEAFQAPDSPGPTLGSDDARVIVDFSIGPSGVGPVTGLDSGDFYPTITQTAADHELSVPEDSG